MTAVARGSVVIDTGIFAARFTPRGKRLVEAYRPLVEGRPAALAFVTVAELRYGALAAGWAERRRTHVSYEVGKVRIVWPGMRLTDVYAAVRAWCVRNGHGLGQKEHEADRWVAATAIYLDVPLIAHDKIFRGVDGLELLTRL